MSLIKVLRVHFAVSHAKPLKSFMPDPGKSGIYSPYPLEIPKDAKISKPSSTCHYPYKLPAHSLNSFAAYPTITSTCGKAISSNFKAYGVGTSAPVTLTGGAFK